MADKQGPCGVGLAALVLAVLIMIAASRQDYEFDQRISRLEQRLNAADTDLAARAGVWHYGRYEQYATVGVGQFQRLERKPRTKADDAIFACLQKDLVAVYSIGPAGPPPIGKPVTADMFTVVCME